MGRGVGGSGDLGAAGRARPGVGLGPGSGQESGDGGGRRSTGACPHVVPPVLPQQGHEQQPRGPERRAARRALKEPGAAGALWPAAATRTCGRS